MTYKKSDFAKCNDSTRANGCRKKRCAIVSKTRRYNLALNALSLATQSGALTARGGRLLLHSDSALSLRRLLGSSSWYSEGRRCCSASKHRIHVWMVNFYKKMLIEKKVCQTWDFMANLVGSENDFETRNELISARVNQFRTELDHLADTHHNSHHHVLVKVPRRS